MPATTDYTVRVNGTGGRMPAVSVRACLAVLMLMVPLSACGSAGSTTGADDQVMTRAAKLALGTIDLEGTDQEVDANGAARLLPLWQLLRDLSTSSSAAAEELEAVVDELEASMTVDQVAAIAAMDLSGAEVAAATQGTGAPLDASQASSASDAQPPVAMDPGLGGDMAGGMPSDDGGVSMEGAMPGEAAAVVQGAGVTDAGTVATANAVSAALFQRVIALLEGKVQS